jgi:hypothetical protein
VPLAHQVHEYPDGTERRYSRGTLDRGTRLSRAGPGWHKPDPRADLGAVRRHRELIDEAALRVELAAVRAELRPHGATAVSTPLTGSGTVVARARGHAGTVWARRIVQLRPIRPGEGAKHSQVRVLLMNFVFATIELEHDAFLIGHAWSHACQAGTAAGAGPGRSWQLCLLLPPQLAAGCWRAAIRRPRAS